MHKINVSISIAKEQVNDIDANEVAEKVLASIEALEVIYPGICISHSIFSNPTL
jgi:hypothetical protein